jgi:N-acetylglucosamine-6-sulfatase
LATDRRPNILVLITDDQDVELGGLDYMPQLKSQLMEQGTFFKNAFVHTPFCCPSRTSILTGRYIHNGGATNNSFSGNCGGTEWKEKTEKEHSFAVHLSNAGYKTAYLGKYLNTYGLGTNNAYVPAGWDHWMANKGNSVYYNYDLVQSEDGGKTISVVNFGNDYATDYLPDVIANKTVELIETFSSADDPFLIVLGYPTPHAPRIPAPKYKDTFQDYRAYRTPNWNSSYNFNKHWLMRRLGVIDAGTEQEIDQFFRARMEMLQTVDDHITQYIDSLKNNGQLQNTYIIFTSDNGFQLGQHRLKGDKRQLYEHNIRVPFVVRGPNVPPNVTNEHLVLNIDIAPTLVSIATNSTKPVDTMDGESFLPLLLLEPQHQPSWRTDFLISYHGEGLASCGCYNVCPLPPPDQYHTGDCFNNTYHCVRILSHSNNDRDNRIYCRFVDDEGFVEYYNLTSDPWQLDNLADQLTASEQTVLESRLTELMSCRGTSCHTRSQMFSAPTQTSSSVSTHAHSLHAFRPSGRLFCVRVVLVVLYGFL